LETLWVGADEALARIAATSEILAEADRYKVHPAVLDAAFHLMAALPAEGTYLPVGVERIEVYRPGVVADWAYVRKVSQSRSRIVVDVSLADEEGRILVAVSGLACQLFDDAKARGRNADRFLYDQVWVEAPSTDVALRRPAWFIPSPATLVPALQLRHDLRNADIARERFARQAVPALDELATAYFIAALSELGFDWNDNIRFTPDELSDRLGIAPRHRRLVAQIVAFFERSDYLAQDGARWHVLTRPPIPAVAALWQSLVLAYPDCHAELALMQRCGSQLAELLRDEIDPLSALFPVGSPIAEQMYADSPSCGPYNRIIADAVAEIVQQLPEGETLRILEVGAGTGGLTALLLPLLPPARSSYVMTDVSHSFINQAKDRFRAFPFVRYEILDADKDPVGSPGFDEGAFDLIVICDALHACADLRVSLGHLRRLLAPNGVLAMMELTKPPRWFDLIFGLLPGWWAFTDSDLRPRHATLPASDWLSLLTGCGFEAGECIADRIGGADSLHSVLLARKPVTATPLRVDSASQAPSRREPHTPIILLADALGIGARLAAELASLGYSAILCGEGSTDPTETNGALEQLLSSLGETDAFAPVVVELRGLAAPACANDTVRPSIAVAAACANLLTVARKLSGPNWQGKPDLWVVTNGTETIGAQATIALEQAPLRGLARVLRNEHAELNTYLVDISPEVNEFDVASLAREIIAANVDEDEIALRGHRKFVNRMIGHRNLRETGNLATAFKLSRERRQAGHDGLSAREVTMPLPGPGQMLVQVRAAGLNFKDYARHASLIDPGSDRLGLEGAGIVTAVGDGVTQFAPGDEVMGLMAGSLSNPTLTNARVVVRKPATLSFEDAAGVPIAYLSAYYALKKQARIAPGESVLIHTAASGLGLAALQVARAFGATVFATAGNDEKRDYLRAYGVGYVGDSRSGAFADDILRLTGGKGVDVVLNTLPAEMNQANIRILSPGGGRLIDLSNVYYGAQLHYETLRKGIQFSAFDLSAIADDNPDLISTMLVELAALFESRALRPIQYRRVPIDRISETLLSFRKAAHIGKVVVSFADDAIDMTPTASAIALRADASYLISGGLSGFGLSTAKWLAEQGAKHLVLVGRRGAVSPEAIEELAELREAGTEVHAVAADVADAQQMQKLLTRFGRDFPPLHGIVHSAMVLHDVAIRDMTRAHLDMVLTPKIDGAWNLHRFSLDQPLDFFICYSSLSAALGNRDQANYAAANEYLEALTRFRRAAGRPALAIGWGAIGGTGSVARDAALQDNFSRQGIFYLGLDQAWAAISLGLRCGVANLYAGVLDWSTMKQFSRGLSSPRFGLIDPGYKGDKEVQGTPRAVLDSTAAPEQRLQQLHAILVREISDVLGIDPQTLDKNRPLIDIGFDSLMAVELIVAIERATGYGFSRMGLLRPGVCTAELITEAADALGSRETPPAAVPSTAAPSQPNPADAIRIDDLSEREVDALLSELVVGE
jgi:NADPH:quinone reductase-like Zn-dependent oxidoreductase/SAM-dependent methyltransferase/aryl carrier-like protein